MAPDFLIDALMVVGGVVFLYGGGELLVRYASALGQALGMSPLVVGLTIVSFATSAPELASTLSAVLRGADAMAVGNIVGSNIANIGLVLGLVAVVRPLKVGDRLRKVDGPIMTAALLLFAFLCWDGRLVPLESAGMLVALVAYLTWLLRQDRKEAPPVEERDETAPMWQIVAGIVAGLALLTLGSDLLIDGATNIARASGVSERVIGLTLVALGTSLPELASSLVAALKDEAELLMGNIFGSNVFNVLAVGGAMGLARSDVSTDFPGVQVDLMVMVGFAVLIGLALAPIGARNTVQRVEGAVLVICYAAYIGTLGNFG